MTTLDLADALLRGARSPLQRAALALLTGLFGLYDRVDVLDRWYCWGSRDGQPVEAAVCWDTVASDADSGAVPMSPGERAVLLIAASLGAGYRVDLGSTLPLLDSQHGANLIMAVYTLNTVATELDPRALGHLGLAGQSDR